MKAEIFEQRHLPRTEGRHDPPGLLADAVGGKRDLAAAQCPAQRRQHRAQRKFRVGAALRPAEMRHHDNHGTPIDQRLDGRRQTFDPGRVGDPAVPDRNVEIGAQQHPFAMDIDVVEDQEIGHRLLRRAIVRR